MPYTVTLKIVDCASPMSLLAGAYLSSGAVNLGYADANGQFIIVVYDDYDYIITITKAAVNPCNPTAPDYRVGYTAKNFVLDRSQDGTIQTVCLNQGPPPQPCGTGPSIECFIVTAATGSAASEEVTSLRQLRERVRAKSVLGGQLVDAIYEEYAQFSPKIAAGLQVDILSRLAVLQIVVKPLFAWYTLAGVLALDNTDQITVSKNVEELLNACPKFMGQTILTKLQALQKGEVLPAGMPEQLIELAPRIAQLPFASWAILDPLIRTYSSAKKHADVVAEVAQWLATAPIEALSHSNNPELLKIELSELADFFNFKPTVRHQLGNRLLAAWPDAALALEHAHFISNL